VTPVEDIVAQARLARIVDVMLADNRRSWQLGPDGRWQRTEVLESVEGTIDTFAVLKDDAALSVVGADHTHAGVGAAGSMDPRA
jgi:polyphosphate kinase